jgi:hypothetical protein
MTPKQDLLERATQEYRAFRAAVDNLADGELGEVWLGTWSVKDVIGHIVGWQRELRPALDRLARGERPILAGVSYDDVDAWNEKLAAAMRGLARADLLAALDDSHAAFLRAAATIPEERFQAGRTAYKLVDLNSAHHYREHADEIGAWRRSKGV